MIGEITSFKRDVKLRAEQLKRAHTRQEQVVAERAAAKQQIEGRLARAPALLASIKGEIASSRRKRRPAGPARGRGPGAAPARS